MSSSGATNPGYGAIPSQNRPQKPVTRAKLSVMAKVAPFLVLFCMVSLTLVSSHLEKAERRYDQVHALTNRAVHEIRGHFLLSDLPAIYHGTGPPESGLADPHLFWRLVQHPCMEKATPPSPHIVQSESPLEDILRGTHPVDSLGKSPGSLRHRGGRHLQQASDVDRRKVG
jgi:hypothetical protein